MAEHNELGKKGEDEAVAYLQDRGYTIIHRNWHSGKRELDIVAEKDREPEDAVTNQKIRSIVASTDAYLKKFQIDLPVRFDIITVVGTEPPYHIEHIKEAFFPPIW